VEKLRTTPYHPQTNGQCERFNRTLLSMLGTLDRESKAHWPRLIKTLVRCYNASCNRMTGYSPHCLMFGYEPRLPLDVDLGLPAPSAWLKGGCKTSYVQRLKRHLEWGFQAARDARSHEAEKAKGLYDERARGGGLEAGDEVLVKINQYTGKHKIADRWEEERYAVLERITDVVYRVEPMDGGRSRVLHRNQLLPLRYRVPVPEGGDSKPDREAKKSAPRPAKEKSGTSPGTSLEGPATRTRSRTAPKDSSLDKGKPAQPDGPVTRSKSRGSGLLLVTAL